MSEPNLEYQEATRVLAEISGTKSPRSSRRKTSVKVAETKPDTPSFDLKQAILNYVKQGHRQLAGPPFVGATDAELHSVFYIHSSDRIRKVRYSLTKSGQIVPAGFKRSTNKRAGQVWVIGDGVKAKPVPKGMKTEQAVFEGCIQLLEMVCNSNGVNSATVNIVDDCLKQMAKHFKMKYPGMNLGKD